MIKCAKKGMCKLIAMCIGISAMTGLALGGASADTGMDSNLFKNGSFEAPVYTMNQQITNAEMNADTLAIGGGTVTVGSEHATQGEQSLKMGGNSSVNQYVLLEAGKQYVFSADLYAPGENGFFELSFYKPSGFDRSQNTGSFTGSKKMLCTYTPAETGNHRLKLANTSGADLYLDNVRVTELREGVVYDGSFEDALEGSYAGLSEIGVNGTGTVVTDKAQDGLKSLKISDGISEFNAYAAAEPNTDYIFTVYVYVEAGKTAAINRELYYYSSSAMTNYVNSGQVTIAGSDGWEKISVPFTAGDSDVRLRCKLTVSNVDYIDNLSFTKLEGEPGVFKNGGFEAPAYKIGAYTESSYTFDTVGVQGGTAEIVSEPKSEGEQALKLTGSGCAVNQLVSLEENSKYTLKMDVRLSETSVMHLDVYNAAGNAVINSGKNTISNIAAGEWIPLAYDFEITDAYDARVKIYSDADETCIDNIRLEKYVPETAEPGIFYNGDFEEYALGGYTETNWSYQKFGIGSVEAEIVKKDAGNQALKITAAADAVRDDSASFNQISKLEAGKIYKLSMKAAVDAGSKNAVKLCVIALADETHESDDWFASNLYTEEVTSTDFTTVAKTFKAPRDCDARIKISVGSEGTMYFDDITLEEVMAADAEFQFDYGTPDEVSKGTEYRVYFPEGILIVAQYNDQGALADVKAADSSLSFTVAADAKEIAIFAFNNFADIQPIRPCLRIPVQSAV